ncbi:hypothetical protein XAUB_31530 [Xanthomonas citri pv. aurantifolii str. ICPB 11122]|nr:hypothetical protein XAUB_31530 [Xanthomonas citri pv. aurantifolii str. ICPB 11122]
MVAQQDVHHQLADLGWQQVSLLVQLDVAAAQHVRHDRCECRWPGESFVLKLLKQGGLSETARRVRLLIHTLPSIARRYGRIARRGSWPIFAASTALVLLDVRNVLRQRPSTGVDNHAGSGVVIQTDAIGGVKGRVLKED